MNLPNTRTINIESKIYLIRGEKVMLDFDLAELYQVPTMRLNEQVRRNIKRFPLDFMFPLSDQEFTILKSQFAISRSGWGGRRTVPLAFTEQGIAIMRAFVKLRQILNSNQELEKKIFELESKYDGKFKTVFAAIRELMSDHSVPRKRIIGLGQKTDD